jgi:hypothetical protein
MEGGTTLTSVLSLKNEGEEVKKKSYEATYK